jgi:hypothetical protein
VGIENKVPDSRTPRRLSAINTTTTPAATHASLPSRMGKADLAFCTPDETETATVNT